MKDPWQVIPLGNIITQRKEFIQIDDLKTYKRCRVQLHAQGMGLRDTVFGSEIKTKKQQICHSGEFLVAEIDAKVGGFGIVPESLEGAIVSSHYFLFKLDENALDRRFLDYFIRTKSFQDQVTAQGSTNYAAIRPEDVLGYKIPLPPLDEQRRIVARIDELAARIEEARELRRRAVTEADALLPSFLGKLFGSLAKQFDAISLDNLSSQITDGPHKTPMYVADGIPFVTVKNMVSGKLNFNNLQRISKNPINGKVYILLIL